MSDPTDIFNWRRLDARTTTSGQPTEEQLPALAALGVKTVLNLALHSHEKALKDERGSVEALGLRYVHRPVDFANPTREDFDFFCETMEGLGEEPVHVHCIMNWRVSAFFYRYRVERLGWDKAKARAEMEAVWTPEGVWARFVGD